METEIKRLDEYHIEINNIKYPWGLKTSNIYHKDDYKNKSQAYVIRILLDRIPDQFKRAFRKFVEKEVITLNK